MTSLYVLSKYATEPEEAHPPGYSTASLMMMMMMMTMMMITTTMMMMILCPTTDGRFIGFYATCVCDV